MDIAQKFVYYFFLKILLKIMIIFVLFNPIEKHIFGTIKFSYKTLSKEIIITIVHR